MPVVISTGAMDLGGLETHIYSGVRPSVVVPVVVSTGTMDLGGLETLTKIPESGLSVVVPVVVSTGTSSVMPVTNQYPIRYYIAPDYYSPRT